MLPRHQRPKHHPQRGNGAKRGRHKKASSLDMRRRIKQWERMQWPQEGEAA